MLHPLPEKLHGHNQGYVHHPQSGFHHSTFPGEKKNEINEYVCLSALIIHISNRHRLGYLYKIQAAVVIYKHIHKL